MKFTEAQLEAAILQLLGEAGYPHMLGDAIAREPDEVLIKDDLRLFLKRQYASDGITAGEIEAVIRELEAYPTADLYESNKAIMKKVADGLLLKREDRSQKDLYIQLIDYSDLVEFRQPDPETLPHVFAEPRAIYKTGGNIFKVVNQLAISGVGGQVRIPDAILYINGLPLVVCEFKSAIRENATIHDAFVQLTVSYRRDIPQLFKYNAFCVISDGVNNKVGSFFAAYEFYYAWRSPHPRVVMSPHPQPLSPEKSGESGPNPRPPSKITDDPTTKSPSPLGRGGGEGTKQHGGGEGTKQRDVNFRGNFNYGKLKERARELRQNQTPAEAMMWGLVRNRQVADLKFRRQHQIGTYIVDFYCDELSLIVELDGEYHFEPDQIEKDKKREADLRALGFDILRFENKQFMDDPVSVLEEIVAYGSPNPQPLSPQERGATGPSPLGRGGGEGTKQQRGGGEGYKQPDGINTLYTLIDGLFHQTTLIDVIRNFVYLPDTSRDEIKILCRYPQYYAATKLYQNIVAHMKTPAQRNSDANQRRDGKGGTYFGATGCGKSYTMLFLTRLLMKSVDLASPTIVLITDRTDLDDQLSRMFTNAKSYIGDQHIVSVESRAELRAQLKGRSSGGVFLTTIHKFTEDTQLLTDRTNVIVISDEAHRSQINLDQKVSVTKEGVKRTYGFAKYLHDSLPNATYVGFTGTPIDATIDVFGPVVDAYTMTESVADEITVPIVYEGRAAKVLLDNSKLEQIEAYYAEAADAGASDYAIDASKRANLNMHSILGDPDRLKALAADFVEHYETRIAEGTTVAGKAIFVCSSRAIAYAFYKEVIDLRPAWAEDRACADNATLSPHEQADLLPMQRIKLVMTRGKDDPAELYEMLGGKEYRTTLDREFKKAESNFKIAIVVDMWLTGFDVPFLDTIYIDKPIQRHNLIQTISRVNRKFAQKEKGLVVDYIGIKKQMNLALAHYSKSDQSNIEEITQSVIVVRDHLDLMRAIFHKFDAAPYFTGDPMQQLHTLNMASEYVQQSADLEKRFMFLAKRMKAAYDICVNADELTQPERDRVHFYLAIRSIIYKLTKGDAPDVVQMNAKVRQMISDALQSDGVEEIFKLGQDEAEIDIFDPDYLAKIDKIKLPNTKIKLLQQLLNKAIENFKRVNRIKGVDFAQQFQTLVDRYNERDEQDTLRSEVLDDFTEEIIDLYHAIRKERESFADMGIDIEEKAFYDILKALTIKYDFDYPEEKLLMLAKEVKAIVDDKAKYTDWSQRQDIKAELKVNLILLLAKHDYPPIDRDEVYQEIFEQAENYKKYRGGAV